LPAAGLLLTGLLLTGLLLTAGLVRAAGWLVAMAAAMGRLLTGFAATGF
jgi:hypothetical protein